MIRIDVFSDPVCPWCYIGATELTRALAGRRGHPFVVEYHPFQLNPDMPRQGVDRAEFLTTRFGGADRYEQLSRPVRERTAAMGLPFDMETQTRMPNTLDAHRLIHWAGLEQRQAEALFALFRAYFVEGRDIGDAEVLADLGAEAGLDRAMVARLLATDADRDDIAARDTHARERGVKAVPTFLIAEQYVVEGAQPATFWTQVIDEIMEKGLPHERA